MTLKGDVEIFTMVGKYPVFLPPFWAQGMTAFSDSLWKVGLCCEFQLVRSEKISIIFGQNNSSVIYSSVLFPSDTMTVML